MAVMCVSAMLVCTGYTTPAKDSDTFSTVESRIFTPTKEYLNNPYIGLGCWADVDLEKIKQDFSMVYVEATWAELEPEEGNYAFENLEKECRFDLWRKSGKHAVFRLVADTPRQEIHMDIPQWLYDITGSGEFYDTEYGKGYCPDYSDETFIAAHARLLRAVADRYDGDSFISYVQLGSVGHWGEWHIHDDIGIKLYADTYDRYIDQYINAFHNTPLLMRRPFNRIRDVNVGLYNDSAGLKESTETWLKWIAEGGAYEDREGELTAMPGRWKTAPVGGELSSLIDDKGVLLGDDFKNQLDMFRRAHTSWIAPGSFVKYEPANETEAHNLKTLLNTIGYRYYVSSVKLSRATNREAFETDITLRNNGTAPIYFPWKLRVKMIYEDGRAEIKDNPVDIRTVIPDEDTVITIKSFDRPKEIYLGIFDPENSDAALKLAMDVQCEDGWYKLR